MGGWSSVDLRTLANRNRQSSRPWLNRAKHHRASTVCRETMHPKQVVVAILQWKATRPPSTQRKQSVTQADKVHFCAKNALCQHLPAAEGAFGKPFMVQMGPFWPLFAVLWLQKVPKTAAQPPKNQPKMRQNHPKMGFEGLLDRLKAISIPSRSTSKRIKNKKLDRF